MPKNDIASSAPLVSVITPAYNRADHVGGVIESVLSQDYPNIEYIILNDGSTDGTWETIRTFGDSVVAVSHTNMGETRTVNEGLRLAKGEILGVVNSDDPVLPGLIRAVVDVLEANKALVAVYPDWDMIDEDGNVLEHIRTEEFSYVEMLRRHHCLPGPGAFFRKHLADQLAGRDPSFRYIADFDFWLRAGLVGPFQRVSRTLATFRWHSGGASTDGMGRAMADEHIRLVRKVYALPDLPSEALKVRAEAFSSAHYIAAMVSGTRTIRKEVYFIKALAYSPTSYVFRYRDRLQVILREFLSAGLAVARRLSRRAMRSLRIRDS